MSRYDRQIYFERLCELREWYRTRGADDAVGNYSIEEAVRDAYLTIDAFEAEIYLSEAPMGTMVGEEPSR